MTGTDVPALLAALRALPGVADARMVPVGADVQEAADEDAGTLRLDLEPGADETDVAQRVGRLLGEGFGLGVDPAGARLVEDYDAEPATASAGAGVPTDAPTAVPVQRARGRATISGMSLVSSGPEVAATVTLAQEGRSVTGRSRGGSSPAGTRYAVASATLRAVEQLSAGHLVLALEHLDVGSVGSRSTVLVALDALVGGRAERLTGAAVVHDDVRQAVVRASLDAVNRRLEGLLAAAPTR